MTDLKQDDEVTPVIFRKWRDGDVIALFPCEPGDPSPATCSSYMRVGQHGAANPQHVILATRAAKPVEYRDLQQELEAAPYGYRLKIYRRYQRRWTDERWRKLTRMAEGATA